MSNIDDILYQVSKPARYTGGEWNSIVKDWESTPIKFALAFPDLYEIGISNLGLRILYDKINRHENRNFLADRVYAPEVDFKKEFEKKGFKVEVPVMPNTSKPEINAWVSHLKKIVGELNEDTYFIGHSIGCQTIMRFLERENYTGKIGKVIFLPVKRSAIIKAFSKFSLRHINFIKIICRYIS